MNILVIVFTIFVFGYCIGWVFCNREWRWYAKYNVPHRHKGNWYFVEKENNDKKESTPYKELNEALNRMDAKLKEKRNDN